MSIHEFQMLHLFEGFGIEIEYMVADKLSLGIKPIVDELFHKIEGSYVDEIAGNHITYSNELASHVLELKTNLPSPTFHNLPRIFQAEITKINRILSEFDAKLLPTGAHPLMDPAKETRIWSHGYNSVYEAYNKIFDCRSHGWANLQSVHLNLPFLGDSEFAKLHTGVRLLLPIISALSASTPIIEGKATGFIDNRLEIYRHNQKLIPEIAGKIIPEAVATEKEYMQKILYPAYAAIAPYDKEGILQKEWLNSRGAIARFDRNTIEIRIIDSQECCLADIAILHIVSSSVKALVAETWQNFDEQFFWNENRLYKIFFDVIKEGQNAVITDDNYLRVFGLNQKSCTVKELWMHIVEQLPHLDMLVDVNSSCEKSPSDELVDSIKFILQHGNLSERILRALKCDYSNDNIKNIYCQLAACLQDGKMFSI